jgi:phenylacetate-CoA ligase
MSSIKTSLLRNLIVPFGDLLFGQRMMQRIKFLEEAQYWPLEKINERRERDLQSLIHTSYTEVPIYHQLMNQSGVHPGEINTLDDLSKLPIITKDMLRAGYPKQTTRSTGRKVFQASTSGSTGKNFSLKKILYRWMVSGIFYPLFRMGRLGDWRATFTIGHDN